MARRRSGSSPDGVRPPRTPRANGAALDGEALDAHTNAWVEAVNRSGAAYLTPAIIGGRWTARVSIGALPTEAEDVEAVWAAMRAAADASARAIVG